MDKKIKIGIIGVGNIAESHIQAYKKNPNVELYAFCDINEERLKAKGEKHGVTRLFADVNEMVKLPELDAVSVCTWNVNHAPCTIAALKAGKNVLCEKPMAMNAEEATEMMKVAKETGKLLMIGFVRRYGNDCDILRDFISTDYFGEFYYAKAQYLRRNGNPGGWFSNKKLSGGGPMIDLGVHVIDFVRFALGNPKPISVYGATFEKLGDRRNLKATKKGYVSSDQSDRVCDVEDLASAMIRFEGGAVLSIEAAFSLNTKNNVGKIELFGTKGGACIDPELEMYTEINDYMANVNLAAPTALSFDGLFDKEINHYVDCLLGKTECRSPAEDGVAMMQILDAVYESARTGHEVVIK